MKFYKTLGGYWVIGTLTIPQGDCLKDLNSKTGVVRIEDIGSGRLMAEKLPTQFQKENGDFYSDLQEFELATNDFFNVNSSSKIYGMAIPEHDYVGLDSYDIDGNLLIINYKKGGVTGTLQATITLSYNAKQELSSITKTTPNV